MNGAKDSGESFGWGAAFELEKDKVPGAEECMLFKL